MRLKLMDAKELIKDIKGLPRGTRMKIIEEYCEEFESHDKLAMELLTDEILREELSDKHADKVTREESPIMSDHQIDRRSSGRKRPRNKAGVTDQEVPLTHLANYATDGFDYTPPVRSFTNPW